MEIKEYPQVKTTVTTFVPAKHSYPIYLYYEEDGLEFEYTKVEKHRRITLKKDLLGTTVKVYTSRNPISLHESYVDNLSDEKTFNKAFKEFLKSVK